MTITLSAIHITIAVLLGFAAIYAVRCVYVYHDAWMVTRKAYSKIWCELQEQRSKYHRLAVDYANLRERGPYR